MDYKKFYDKYGAFNMQLDKISEPSYTVTYAWAKTKRRLESLLLSEITSRLTSKKELRIADIGCGDGSLLIHMAMAVDSKALVTFEGYDLSDSFVEFGNFAADAKKVCDRVSFSVFNLENDTLNDEKFDVIVMSEVLEHLTDQRESLTRIYNALRPGGVLLLSTPNSRNMIKYPLYPLKKIFKRGNDAQISKKLTQSEETFVLAEEEQHLHVFYHGELRNLIKKVGFKGVTFYRSSLVFGGPLLDKWRLFFAFLLTLDVVLDWLNAYTFGWDIVLKAQKPVKRT